MLSIYYELDGRWHHRALESMGLPLPGERRDRRIWLVIAAAGAGMILGNVLNFRLAGKLTTNCSFATTLRASLAEARTKLGQ